MRFVLFFISLTFLINVNTVLAQDYSISKIQSDWLSKAPAVVRKSEHSSTVNSKGEISFKVKIAYTILKQEANELAVMDVNYSKSILFKSLSGKIFDPFGKEIKKSKKSDIQDFSNFSSFSIYEDNRQKVLDLKQFKLPYTVEFEYEVIYPNLYYINSWVPQNFPNIPVQHASVSYQYPKDIDLRFFSASSSIPVYKSQEVIGDSKVFALELSNLEILETEPLMPSPVNYLPILYVAPAQFDYDGYKGDLTSWKSFGYWINDLNKDKDALSDQMVSKIHELTSGLDNDIEKTKVLYQYLQEKTRYVSIQLGIGGLMPFEASLVEKYGYGDCKALSNFMKAMLKEAGINSHYTLIHGGKNVRKIYEEFPKDYFNHVILAVPLEKDTIWLECTSQSNPFGYLGDFTSGRQALMITDNGGYLTTTPKYTYDHNVQTTKAFFDIRDNGISSYNVETVFKGLQVENGSLLNFINQSNDQKRKWFSQNFGLTNFTLENLNFNFLDGFSPIIEMTTNGSTKGLVTFTGSRIILQPNQLNVYSSNIRNTKKSREFDFEVLTGFIDEDLFEYTLPNEYLLETSPEDVYLESEFGIYKLSFTLNNNKLTYARSLCMYNGTFEHFKFDEYLNFLAIIEKFDKTKLIFTKSK
ncbi:DUF3857 domain-containing protein [Belliella pelovolcani]|uniref:DUF3857 domain-containing protein n=1 Tax=Belliella pelovolcani TaxID=529505 RepID=A0A1N7P3B6_9BACT|nr:DUF3857 domain-containing protein [Belliella pelovolcani]SIT05081.1 protein of unknown function [Belliella pelovolcani]